MISLKWYGNKCQLFIVHNYYLILVAVYVLSIHVPIVRTGVAMSFVLLYLYTSCKIIRFASSSAGLVFFFLIYCIFSVQGYFYNELPISVYWAEISTQLLPMIFFFIPFNQEVDKERFYRIFVVAITIAIVLGIYYYIFNPPAYIQYIVKTANTAYEGSIGVSIQRFNSIFGSTIMGSFSVFMIIIIIYRFWDVKKEYSFLSLLLYLLLYIIAFVSAILTAQRSSMALAFFCVVFMYICSILCRKKILKSFTFFDVLLYVVVVTVIFTIFQEYFYFFDERIDSIDGAFDERNGQWIDTFKHSENIIFGTGLGSAGHKVLAFTKYHITDGALFKITAECGIVGLIFFLYIIIKCLVLKIKYFPCLFREYLIIVVCLAQSTGSNTLVFQQILPIFWFSLGSIANYYKTKDL